MTLVEHYSDELGSFWVARDSNHTASGLTEDSARANLLDMLDRGCKDRSEDPQIQAILNYKNMIREMILIEDYEAATSLERNLNRMVLSVISIGKAKQPERLAEEAYKVSGWGFKRY